MSVVNVPAQYCMNAVTGNCLREIFWVVQAMFAQRLNCTEDRRVVNCDQIAKRGRLAQLFGKPGQLRLV